MIVIAMLDHYPNKRQQIIPSSFILTIAIISKIVASPKVRM